MSWSVGRSIGLKNLQYFNFCLVVGVFFLMLVLLGCDFFLVCFAELCRFFAN